MSTSDRAREEVYSGGVPARGRGIFLLGKRMVFVLGREDGGFFAVVNDIG